MPVEARGAGQISWNLVFCIYSLAVSKPLGVPPTKQRTRFTSGMNLILHFRFHVANDAVALLMTGVSMRSN